jgi:hypothetical protein
VEVEVEAMKPRIKPVGQPFSNSFASEGALGEVLPAVGSVEVDSVEEPQEAEEAHLRSADVVADRPLEVLVDSVVVAVTAVDEGAISQW